MATVTQKSRAAAVSVDPPQRKIRPIKWWAGLGAVCLALQTYAFGAWILSGPERTDTGPTPVPGFMTVAARVHEILGLGLAVFCVYYWVIRPRRRLGHLSQDGLMVLAFATLWWMDPGGNLLGRAYTWNSVFYNWGSWSNHLPGWMSPNGSQFPEPLIFESLVYLWYWIMFVAVAGYVMRWSKRRWPALGKFGQVAITALVVGVFESLFELAWVRLGLYVYPTAIKEITLFHGHYYQFPLNETVFIGLCMGLMTAVREFRDDRGRTVAERGIDFLKVTQRQKSWIRFLAFSGIFNACFAVYNIGMTLFGLYGGAWPADIANRSYLTNGYCGAGTDRACPGPDVPFARRGSSYVTRDGRVVGFEPEGSP